MTTGAITTVETARIGLSAEQKFRIAAGIYDMGYDQLKATLQAGNAPVETVRELVSQANNTGESAYKSFIEFAKDNAQGKLAMAYVKAASVFASHNVILANNNLDPLSPQFRRKTKAVFEDWRRAELNYAQAGYRTISLADWMGSIPVEGTLHRMIFTSLLIKRDAGEDQVLHALELRKKTPKLAI
jgi:hypothetical protein